MNCQASMSHSIWMWAGYHSTRTENLLLAVTKWSTSYRIIWIGFVVNDLSSRAPWLCWIPLTIKSTFETRRQVAHTTTPPPVQRRSGFWALVCLWPWYREELRLPIKKYSFVLATTQRDQTPATEIPAATEGLATELLLMTCSLSESSLCIDI